LAMLISLIMVTFPISSVGQEACHDIPSNCTICFCVILQLTYGQLQVNNMAPMENTWKRQLMLG
jgi:hypothetical protein